MLSWNAIVYRPLGKSYLGFFSVDFCDWRCIWDSQAICLIQCLKIRVHNHAFSNIFIQSMNYVKLTDSPGSCFAEDDLLNSPRKHTKIQKIVLYLWIASKVWQWRSLTKAIKNFIAIEWALIFIAFFSFSSTTPKVKQ